MAEEKSMEITFMPDGSVKIEAFGFIGASCTDATKVMQEALGEMKSREFKDEYYRSADLVVKIDQLCG